MVVMTPALAAFALKTLPDFAALMGLTIGGKKGKKIAKQAEVLKGLLGVPELIGGAFKSPSTGLKIGEGTKGVGPFADADEYIGGLTGSIADKTQQNFADWSDMRIGSPMDHLKEQANRYNSLFG